MNVVQDLLLGILKRIAVGIGVISLFCGIVFVGVMVVTHTPPWLLFSLLVGVFICFLMGIAILD